ncbi:MAG: hypothetical protein H0X26_08930 [Alphaproteobacteria bacterium]|nr:hypothetical protein [Alphaproteobacteria bacterium]
MKKKISALLKLKVAIQSLKGDMTIGEIDSKYEVSPSEIHRGKRQLLAEGESAQIKEGWGYCDKTCKNTLNML